MDATQFIDQSRTEPDIAALVSEIASDTALDTDDDTPARRYLEVAPTDAVWMLSAYTLYRLVKLGLDWLRDRSEEKTATARLALITALNTEDGYTQEEAEKSVNALFQRLAVRGADDPVLARTQALIKGG